MPRSGIGLNELLAPPRKTNYEDASAAIVAPKDFCLAAAKPAKTWLTRLALGKRRRRWLRLILQDGEVTPRSRKKSLTGALPTTALYR